ncbi:branched-subunit amino acid transport protein [Enterococcus sp. PF1-24]|uniref:AzlD domain-containing protein n=1 Tax=unclassified Enterococcus TaxID=2608891 RepID=UPI0024733016|nr:MULTISPECIES: AzlD domain-containing protein [unclassified Enterococcus]MDH6364945.1 branched-subunit amino acid transport protein [Enterococcus sp. PFB1-1]MDH6402046.1 branched-subunit amino acid transport protein [Enterococcus sp. PF1-24]
MSSQFILLLLGGCLITWLPRVVPFLLSKKVDFPKWLNDFLAYLPLCILTALLFQSILVYRQGQFPAVKVLELIACLPTFAVAIKTKDLMKTVLVAVVTIALLRFIF